MSWVEEQRNVMLCDGKQWDKAVGLGRGGVAPFGVGGKYKLERRCGLWTESVIAKLIEVVPGGVVVMRFESVALRPGWPDKLAALGIAYYRVWCPLCEYSQKVWWPASGVCRGAVFADVADEHEPTCLRVSVVWLESESDV